MKGTRKKPKLPGLTRVALAENVRYLMEDKYAESLDRPRALAKDAGVGLYTVQRLLDAVSGANLDTIEAVGKVFKTEPFELLTPMYAKRRGQAELPTPERVVAMRQRRPKSS